MSASSSLSFYTSSSVDFHNRCVLLCGVRSSLGLTSLPLWVLEGEGRIQEGAGCRGEEAIRGSRLQGCSALYLAPLCSPVHRQVQEQTWRPQWLPWAYSCGPPARFPAHAYPPTKAMVAFRPQWRGLSGHLRPSPGCLTTGVWHTQVPSGRGEQRPLGAAPSRNVPASVRGADTGECGG